MSVSRTGQFRHKSLGKHIKIHRGPFSSAWEPLYLWNLSIIYLFNHLLDLFILILCVAMSAFMYVPVHYVWAWSLQRPEEGVRPSGTGITDGCKQPCGYQELSFGLLQQQVFLISVLFLHTRLLFFFCETGPHIA